MRRFPHNTPPLLVLLALGASAPVQARPFSTYCHYAPLALSRQSTPMANAMVASALSRHADLFLVGARGDSTRGPFAGAAHFLRLNPTTAALATESSVFASDPFDNDLFGFAVALSADVAVISAPFDDDSYSSSGSVYVFAFDGVAWNQTQKLVAPDPGPFHYFGQALALDETHLLVGARQANGNAANSGAVYVFTRNTPAATFTYTHKLSPAASAAVDNFGAAIALTAAHALIGAPLRDDNFPNSGAAYIYNRNGPPGAPFVEHAKLLADNPATGSNFGQAVALQGDVALIGAPSHNITTPAPAKPFAGSAYIFQRNATTDAWTLLKRLESLAPLANERMGASVAIRLDSGANYLPAAAIGAPGAVGSSTIPGAVYVFSLNPANSLWEQRWKLVAPTAANNDTLAATVAFYEHLVIAGAPTNDTPASEGSPLKPDAGALFPFDLRPSMGRVDVNHDGIVNAADLELVTNDFNWEGAKRADLVPDLIVNFLDLLPFLDAYGQTGSNIPADFNRDGVVNFLDLVYMLSAFARHHSHYLDPTTATDINQNGIVDQADLTAVTNEQGLTCSQ
ncbi:MAG: dockerin type I domain-containing protein [Phycisphaerales bacterium]